MPTGSTQRPRATSRPSSVGVVVVDAESALVERLLDRPYAGGERARERSPQRSGSVHRHVPDCNGPTARG